MKCAYDGCGNDVRCIDEYGQLCCGICPVKHGADSIRISDVPKLVGWSRDIVNTYRSGGYIELERGDIDAAAELLGTKPRDRDLSLVPWPTHVPLQYNGRAMPCDMYTGPCSCGAWHREGK